MHTISAPALSLSQSGKLLHVVKVNVGQLKQMYREDPASFSAPPASDRKGLVIDRFNSLLEPGDPAQGYQRNIEINRARRFASYLQEAESLSPTAILVNDRDGQVKFDPKTGMLTIDIDLLLYLYDGQHRTLGYLLGLADNPHLASFEVIMIITVGLDKITEMRLFNVVNSRAKGVPTNLVNEILTATYKASDDKAEFIEEMPLGDVKKATAVLAMHALNDDPDGPWYRKLVLANQKKPTRADIKADSSLKHERLLGSASMLTSLGPVYSYLEVNGWLGLPSGGLEMRATQIAQIVSEFWKAIRDLMPEPFEEPLKYVLQSESVGSLSLHLSPVLPNLLGRMFSARRPWVEAEFKVMLNHCEWFTDEKMWQKDNPHGASVYTGKPGMTKLASLIKTGLFDSVGAEA